MPLVLNSSQLQALAAAIAADPVLDALPKEYASSQQVADAFNLPANPDYWVWRTTLGRSEVVNGTSPDGTTFNWTGTGYIGRSAGERDAWREIWNHSGICNPSQANVRQAFVDIFSGATAPAPANRAHIQACCRRKATRLEQLFATGVGSTATPGLLGFEGAISYEDVLASWGL